LRDGNDYKNYTTSKRCLPPIAMYLKNNHGVIRLSLDDLGCLSIMSKSGGLKPKAVAGRPSVTKFTHKSCTGIKDSGKPNAAVKKMQTTFDFK
jgi:hypothetical protein